MMDRLTGDFKGASMFATVEQARIYNKLRQYEDTGLTPDEIAALRAEVERLRAERDAMRERAEAAERDIRDMLYEAALMADSALCPWCERYDKPNDLCWAGSCKDECKWCGPQPAKEASHASD